VGKMYSVHAGDVGAVAEVYLDGEQLAMLTASEHPVRFSVSIDGGPAVEVQRPQHGLSTTWAGGAAPGLHRLRVEVLEGRLQVDGIERWRASGAVDVGSSCACRSGSAGGGWTLVALAVPWLRRRRAVNR